MRRSLWQRARDRSDRLIKLRRTLVGQCLVRRVLFRTARRSPEIGRKPLKEERSDSQDNARAVVFLRSSAFLLVAQLRGKVFGTAQNYPHRSRSRYLRFNDTAFCANFLLLPPFLRHPLSPFCLFNQRHKWWIRTFRHVQLLMVLSSVSWIAIQLCNRPASVLLVCYQG